jgi:hypothetical protein
MIIGNDFGDKKNGESVQLLQRILFGKDGPKSSDLDAKVNVKLPDFRPQFVPLPLAQTKNDDKNYFENKKFHAVNEKALNGFSFFLFGRGGEQVYFCFFPCSQICSHPVLMGFPKFPSCSPRLSQQHLSFIPYVLPKVQLSCIQIEKGRP